jgi:CBS domain-containing protein
VLASVPVEAAMLTRFESVEPGAPLSRAMELTLAGSQKDFPVLDRGRLAGVLTQERLVAAVTAGGGARTVADVMEPVPPALDPRDPLAPALERLQDGSARVLPVMEAGRLVGIVTADNVLELLRFRSALEAWSRSSARREPRETEKTRCRLATG